VFPPKHGGSGRWLWELYRRLEHVDVAVLAGSVPGDAAFDQTAPFPIERFERGFVSWGLLDLKGALGYRSAIRQVKRAVGRYQPDAVHCGKCLPEGLIALLSQRRTRLPYWVYVHGEELTLTRTSHELRWWTKAVLRRAAGIVANSEHTKRLLIENWALTERAVTVLTPGVDTTWFVPAPPDPSTRRALGWNDRRVILTVGARKGQDMLIRALPEIRRRCPDVLYAIAGDGWEREYLDALVLELGVQDAVQFMGAPNEVRLRECYQQCDLFALPNRQVGWDFEGFGIVLLEAQACGKPVVAGASGGTAETLTAGRTGERIAAELPETLAAVCSALLDDPARRAAMGAQARTWAVEHFDWSVRTRQATSLFAPSASAR
jgi:phosphatidylinositol alpha-1,6-mannosyltransferase